MTDEDIEKALRYQHDLGYDEGYQAARDEAEDTLWRTTTRNTTRTVYGNKRPVCEVCGYGIGDKRWSYCPKCGAWIVEEDK